MIAPIPPSERADPFLRGQADGRPFQGGGRQIYAGGQQGLARDMEHALLNQTARELTASETRAIWPYDFALRTTF